MASFLQILRILPSLISLGRTLLSKMEEGWTEYRVKQSIKEIEEAFKERDKPLAAKKLNDVFRT